MPGRNSHKIVIVGGGLAGLAAAFELTKPGLYAGEDVTIYQMGWRLGGKCASGRDENGRIVEHGLHVWFGYYENAFRLLRELYEEWNPPADQAIKTWGDAFKPQDYTPVGIVGERAGRTFVPLRWAVHDGLPGDGVRTSVWDSVLGVIELLAQFYDGAASSGTISSKNIKVRASPEIASVYRRLGVSDEQEMDPGTALRTAHRLSTEIGAGQFSATDLEAVINLLRGINSIVGGAQETEDDRMLAQLADVVVAFVCGVLDDILVKGRTITELDRHDFREWLMLNGAQRASAYGSVAVRALYDMMFQYCEGQIGRPSYAAGTAAQVVLRLLGAYKDHAIWEAQAGMGEVLVAPLYEVLKSRGVQFRFFHKLERIGLSWDGRAVESLHFLRQADALHAEYSPTIRRNGLTCWPSVPLWDYLLNNDEIRDVDFESRWCTQCAGSEVLERGAHFAEVILAIPLGGFKPLGRSRGPCDELIRASPRFRTMAERIGLVPSLSVQVWCTRTLADLGWNSGKPAMLSAPEALSIWADMSQVLEREGWETDRPSSVHYFCNVFDSQAYRGPSTAGEAVRKVRALSVAWFQSDATKLWPRFEWQVLFDPRNRDGSNRIDAQVLGANVDPSSCCASSSAGSTRWRIKTDDSGFEHLFLAGAWIDTGFNTECVEAAIMSGKQASRAICGSPALVDGEDFLRSPGPAQSDALYELLFGAPST